MSTEEVPDCHHADRRCVSVCGGGESVGEAVLSAAAGVRPEPERTFVQATIQRLQASPRVPQRPQTRGQCHTQTFMLLL